MKSIIVNTDNLSFIEVKHKDSRSYRMDKNSKFMNVPNSIKDFKLKIINLEITKPEFWFKLPSTIVHEKPMVVAWLQSNNPSIISYTEPESLENWTESEAIDPSYEYHPEMKAGINVTVDFVGMIQDQLTNEYNNMSFDVYSQMSQVFKTTKSDSASAFYETWKQMVEFPAMFLAINMISDIAFDSVEIGNILDTEAKIIGYANSKLNAAMDYAVYRVQRIQQFQLEKAQLEGHIQQILSSI